MSKRGLDLLDMASVVEAAATLERTRELPSTDGAAEGGDGDGDKVDSKDSAEESGDEGMEGDEDKDGEGVVFSAPFDDEARNRALGLNKYGYKSKDAATSVVQTKLNAFQENTRRVQTGKSKDAVYSLEMHERCREEELLSLLMKQDDIGKVAAVQRNKVVAFLNYSKGLTERLYSVDEYDRLSSSGKIAYLKQCSHINVPPSNKVLEMLGTNQMGLSHYGIAEKGTIALAEALITNKSVTVLDLENNWIGEGGAKAIAMMLRDLNKTILQVDLSENWIGLSSGLAIATIFEVNKTLHDIRLCRNQLTDAVAEALALSLSENPVLERLDLSNNSIGTKGGIALAKMLKDNNSLTDVNFSWNSLREGGGVAMAQALEDNTKLLKLNCSWNGIGSKGGVAFARNIMKNMTLLHCDISNNRIGGINGGAVTEMVGKGKEVPVDVWKCFADAIEHNSSLEVLNINGNAVGPEDAELLHEKRQTNTTMQHLVFEGLEALVLRSATIKKEKEEADKVQAQFQTYMKKLNPGAAAAAAPEKKKK